ncbi:MAG: LysR family transcriptional regulator [Bdellovibrionota bacterium]
MDNLHWQLSILSKAIHYKNLSGAASHVGVSQPQLSRIISRLEGELGVVLLDRTARRKSGWTPVAYKIADTYFRTSRKLTQSLQQLKSDDQLTQLSVGTLEGLVPLASDFCHQLQEQPRLQMIELNVYDLSELEERFEKDEIDLIFTCREPGRHKYKNVRQLGYQAIDRVGPSDGPKAFSQYEYAQAVHNRRVPPKDLKVVMSNSLAVRRLWIDSYGASGFVPSDVRKRKSEGAETPVIMIGADLLSPAVWQKFEQIRL